MVQVIFSFPSNEQRIEESFEVTITIHAVKTHLLTHRWPSSLPPPESVGRLRLFAMGKELGDSTKLSQVKLSQPDGPLPLLVHITERTSSQPDPVQNPCCSCVLI